MADAGVDCPVAEQDKHILRQKVDGAGEDFFVVHPQFLHGVRAVFARPQQDDRGVVKLDDPGGGAVPHLEDGKGGIGYLPLLADRQGTGDGADAFLHRQAFGHHGGDNFSGQGGEDVGFHSAAQAVGQHQGYPIWLLDPLHPVAAELFALLV